MGNNLFQAENRLKQKIISALRSHSGHFPRISFSLTSLQWQKAPCWPTSNCRGNNEAVKTWYHCITLPNVRSQVCNIRRNHRASNYIAHLNDLASSLLPMSNTRSYRPCWSLKEEVYASRNRNKMSNTGTVRVRTAGACHVLSGQVKSAVPSPIQEQQPLQLRRHQIDFTKKWHPQKKNTPCHEFGCCLHVQLSNTK